MSKSKYKLFDEDYFERGLTTGKSCYENYHWMPEDTIRMANFIAKDLSIKNGSKILDFGCAKGYLVKAFRILGYQAYGADISEYAILNADKDIKNYCRLIKSADKFNNLFDFKFDWVIAKDVFEHIPEKEIPSVLRNLSLVAKKMFLVIPLGKDDNSGKFVITDYGKDITHITAKTDEWWKECFQNNNFSIKKISFKFRYCKEKWTSKWPKGNSFYVLKSKII